MTCPYCGDRMSEDAMSAGQCSGPADAGRSDEALNVIAGIILRFKELPLGRRESLCVWVRDLLAEHLRKKVQQQEFARLRDLPLCRLQLPDGSVPGGTEEALAAWHDVAEDALQQVRVLRPGGTYAWKTKCEQAEAIIAACRVLPAYSGSELSLMWPNPDSTPDARTYSTRTMVDQADLQRVLDGGV